MINVSGTPGFSRYIDAKINCAVIDALESLGDKLYLAKRALAQALPPRNLVDEEKIWFTNKNLNAVASHCSPIPSLAIVIQYERYNNEHNPNNPRRRNVRFN